MTDYQRLEKVIKILEISSFKDFAGRLGVNPQTFYDIKQGKHGISKKLAELINKNYPDFPVSWLLTGEGDIQVGNTVGDESNVANNIGGDNLQNSGAVIEALANQLKEKDRQIAKSQEQIDRLLSIIEKMNS